VLEWGGLPRRAGSVQEREEHQPYTFGEEAVRDSDVHQDT
jgi:hypothetical protein